MKNKVIQLFLVLFLIVTVFGEVSGQIIQVFVYNDIDVDGTKNTGEPPLSIPNPILFFDANGDGIAETNTMIVPSQPEPGTYNYNIAAFGNGVYQLIFDEKVGEFYITNPLTGFIEILYPSINSVSVGYSKCISLNLLARPSCEQVLDTLCDLLILDVGCARMPSPPLIGPAPNPLCEGKSTAENMSWFAFVAGNGDYTIQIIPFLCTAPQGEPGVQVGVYNNCSFEESIFCAADPCISPNEPVNISSELLTPGKLHFLWIDGCSGSECSYEVNILGNFEQFTIPEPTEVVCINPNGCQPLCPNDEVTVKVNGGFDFLQLDYFWKVIGPDNSIQYFQTNNNKLTYKTGSLTGTYRILFYEIRSKCDVSFEEGYIDIIVQRSEDNECVKDLRITPEINETETGKTIRFNAFTSDTNAGHIWQSDFGQGFQTLKNVGEYSGTTNNSLEIKNVRVSNHLQKIRAISSSCNCIDTSNVAEIFIVDTCLVTVRDTIIVKDTLTEIVYDTTFITITENIAVTDTLIINLNIPISNNQIAENKIIIYPNPASSFLIIDNGDFSLMENYEIQILNAVGQPVYFTPIEQKIYTIDLNGWGGKGTYFLKIKNPNGATIQTKKIVLQ